MDSYIQLWTWFRKDDFCLRDIYRRRIYNLQLHRKAIY